MGRGPWSVVSRHWFSFPWAAAAVLQTCACVGVSVVQERFEEARRVLLLGLRRMPLQQLPTTMEERMALKDQASMDDTLGLF